MADTYSFLSLDFYDEETGFVVREVYLENFQEDELPKSIRHEIRQLGANQSEPLKCNIAVDWAQCCAGHGQWNGLPIRLRRESSVLPYRVHGGREFDLMIKGVKPLSVFSLCRELVGPGELSLQIF